MLRTMEPEELFNKLDTNLANARQEFVDYLHSVSQELEQDTASAPRIAYDIAGMFATKFAHQLDEEDPLIEIMTIAGELEVKPENTDELRRELIDKIAKQK